MIEAVVFDFDGLIIDSEWVIYESAGDAFAEHGQAHEAGQQRRSQPKKQVDARRDAPSAAGDRFRHSAASD